MPFLVYFYLKNRTKTVSSSEWNSSHICGYSILLAMSQEANFCLYHNKMLLTNYSQKDTDWRLLLREGRKLTASKVRGTVLLGHVRSFCSLKNTGVFSLLSVSKQSISCLVITRRLAFTHGLRPRCEVKCANGSLATRAGSPQHGTSHGVWGAASALLSRCACATVHWKRAPKIIKLQLDPK